MEWSVRGRTMAPTAAQGPTLSKYFYFDASGTRVGLKTKGIIDL